MNLELGKVFTNKYGIGLGEKECRSRGGKEHLAGKENLPSNLKIGFKLDFTLKINPPNPL
jgi:hypothetical protein